MSDNAQPMKPTFEWLIHELCENTNTQQADNNNDQSVSHMTIQNLDAGEFGCRIEVDAVTQKTINMAISSKMCETPVDENGRMIKLACIIDITEVTKSLMKSAVESCETGVNFSEEMILGIAQNLAKAIVTPLDEIGENFEPVIFSLVPAVAMLRETGQMMAYGVGQLVTRGDNNSEMIMVVRGYAINIQSRQEIVESISQSLLPVIETSI